MKQILLAAMLALISGAATAHDYRLGPLEIKHPWARATPKGASVAGGYLTIVNTGKEPDRLVGGSSPAAGRFEIHEMRMSDGMMRMRALPKGLELKPGATVELKPGSYHLMFMNLKQPFVKGERVKGTLTFEKAGSIEVEYVVEAVGAAPAQGGHHGH
ncbi:MAG: copper chaperone PCu(A)C [Alphaproteobacteria bacterium]|nr:copper chaperone PCu(A)C [Alphaproteobacteria bacterium]